jgi:phosphoribosylglycinamide formyltransferase 1
MAPAAARKRVGVLVSGSGTNLQALIDAARAQDYPAEIAVVISNVAGARALERAREAGIPAETLPHGAYPDRAAFDLALLEALRRHRIEICCLAGFMRLLGPPFLRDFGGPVLNIHPALLPAFPGMHAVRQALAYGARISGCTVHLVDEGTDTGPVVAQAAVPVLADDDEARLAARIHAEEHRLYPLALRQVAEGRAIVQGRRVWNGGPPRAEGLSLRNPG